MEKSPHRVSVNIISVLLLLIPITNISLLLISNPESNVWNNGLLSFKGTVILAGLSLLIVFTAFLHQRSRIVFRGFLIAICILIPLVFIIIDTRNYVLQTIIISIVLVFLLYFLNLDDTPKPLSVQLNHALISHNLMLITLIIISTKLDLLDISWNRYSILTYLVLYVAFFLIVEYLQHQRKYPVKLAAISWALVFVVAVFFLFDTLSFLFIFLFLLFLIYFPIHESHYDRYLIDLLFENPYKLLIFTFASVALIGGLLLSMPFSSASGEGIPFIDSLFTATSAVCVTGLVVLNTYRDFSPFGQVIILILIQVGGLGIVTIMTFISLLMGQSIGISQEYVVSEIVGSQRPKMVYDLIRFIILVTAVIELTGAALLSIGFYLHDGNLSLSLWKGLFHAVSAFCNAGFDLQGDSLVAYNQTFLIPMTVCSLIVIGGLGFPVIAHLFETATGKSDLNRQPVLVKMSLILTLILIVLGYLVFLTGEYNNTFANLPGVYRHTNALFLSITPRTAGFNTVDMSRLSGSTMLFLWILMFIGAGSCSTAGGIKITTLGVLVATFMSYIKGRAKTIIFEKRLPSILVTRSLILTFASIILILFVAIVLQMSQKLSLSETVFETISAFGTVGLSVGATPKLNDFGKFLIVIVMFAGRVNVLTFISLFVSTRTSVVRYPEESIMIG